MIDWWLKYSFQVRRRLTRALEWCKSRKIEPLKNLQKMENSKNWSWTTTWSLRSVLSVVLLLSILPRWVVSRCVSTGSSLWNGWSWTTAPHLLCLSPKVTLESTMECLSELLHSALIKMTPMIEWRSVGSTSVLSSLACMQKMGRNN
jgi:hypothetical protein